MQFSHLAAEKSRELFEQIFFSCLSPVLLSFLRFYHAANVFESTISTRNCSAHWQDWQSPWPLEVGTVVGVEQGKTGKEVNMTKEIVISVFKR